MQLRTENGNLTLGSVYKLCVWIWLLSWNVIFLAFFGVIALIAVLHGEMQVNGEVVHGRGAVLLNLLPFFILFPLIVSIQAFMFGGLLTFGAWLYRRWRGPITVIAG